MKFISWLLQQVRNFLLVHKLLDHPQQSGLLTLCTGSDTRDRADISRNLADRIRNYGQRSSRRSSVSSYPSRRTSVGMDYSRIGHAGKSPLPKSSPDTSSNISGSLHSSLIMMRDLPRGPAESTPLPRSLGYGQHQAYVESVSGSSRSGSRRRRPSIATSNIAQYQQALHGGSGSARLRQTVDGLAERWNDYGYLRQKFEAKPDLHTWQSGSHMSSSRHSHASGSQASRSAQRTPLPATPTLWDNRHVGPRPSPPPSNPLQAPQHSFADPFTTPTITPRSYLHSDVGSIRPSRQIAVGVGSGLSYRPASGGNSYHSERHPDLPPTAAANRSNSSLGLRRVRGYDSLGFTYNGLGPYNEPNGSGSGYAAESSVVKVKMPGGTEIDTVEVRKTKSKRGGSEVGSWWT